jgi:hypothetical protein
MMTPKAQALLDAALSLSDQDKTALAEALLEALAGPESPGTDEAWKREVMRRYQALETREPPSIRWDDLKDQL